MLISGNNIKLPYVCPETSRSFNSIKGIIRTKRGLFYVHEIWKKDEIRINNIKELGYKIMIVWEYDFLKIEKKQ